MKDKNTAGLLALIPAIVGLVTGGTLGYFNGLHWIYLGGRHTTKGVVYLLISLIVSPTCVAIAVGFCWLIIPLVLLLVPFVMSIINLVEGIRLMGMSQAEFDATYNDVYGPSRPNQPYNAPRQQNYNATDYNATVRMNDQNNPNNPPQGNFF